MTTYTERTATEQAIIAKAYEFEIKAIEACDSSPNPYKDAVQKMGLWEALNEAVEMALA